MFAVRALAGLLRRLALLFLLVLLLLLLLFRLVGAADLGCCWG